MAIPLPCVIASGGVYAGAWQSPSYRIDAQFLGDRVVALQAHRDDICVLSILDTFLCARGAPFLDAVDDPATEREDEVADQEGQQRQGEILPQRGQGHTEKEDHDHVDDVHLIGVLVQLVPNSIYIAQGENPTSISGKGNLNQP